MSPHVSVSRVHKRFGLTKALQDISIEVSARQAVALVGDNGAGKSTLLAIIAGVVRPSAGEVTVLGARPFVRREFVRIASRVGIVLHQAMLYPQLSVEQNFALFSALFGIRRSRRAEEVLSLLGVAQLAERTVSELSQGMLKRVAIARALLHKPELLILDEPFAHLDVEWKERVARLIREHVESGGTALFSSHEPELIRATGALVVPISAGRVVPGRDITLRDESDAVLYAR